MADIIPLDPSWEQIQGMRLVDASSLETGDEVFVPGMATVYRTFEDGSVRFVGGLYVSGVLWFIDSVIDGVLTAHSGSTMQVGPTHGERLLRLERKVTSDG